MGVDRKKDDEVVKIRSKPEEPKEKQISTGQAKKLTRKRKISEVQDIEEDPRCKKKQKVSHLEKKEKTKIETIIRKMKKDEGKEIIGLDKKNLAMNFWAHEEYEIEDILADKNQECYFMEIEKGKNKGRIVGYLKLHFKGRFKKDLSDPEYDEKNSVEIDSVCIDPKFHGNGLGKKFVDFSIELAKRKRKKSLFLFVGIGNKKSIGLWERYKFKRVLTIDNYYETEDQKKAYKYVLQLK